MSSLLYILLSILIFGVLIAIHEFGHFIAARLCGVKVLEFSMGMGPVLWQKDSDKGTLFSVRCLPIGGYCALEGEDDDSDSPTALINAPLWKKLIIMAAGSAMNFLLGFAIVLALFARAEGFVAPVITGFMEGCPYESADGLQVGDRFYKIDGERIYFSVDVSLYMERSAGEYKDIVVIRDGHKVTLNHYPMTLLEYTDADTGQTVMKYGLYFEQEETGLLAKVKYAWYSTMDFVRMVRIGITDLFTGAAALNQLTGVVGVVDVMTEMGTEAPTVADGLMNVFYLGAFIAVNLAVMNMLPLPALDGGRIFFLLITWLFEHIFRRRLDPKYEGYVNTAGFVLLMGLMVYVMYNDIARIITR